MCLEYISEEERGDREIVLLARLRKIFWEKDQTMIAKKALNASLVALEKQKYVDCLIYRALL